jgi:hypothetical protein
MGRSVLASGDLGQHNGLPVTVVVSTTLQELESRCGRAVTATGSLLPMSTVIRMASHSYHYLAIFDKDNGRALHLGRTRRIASADQRIVLLARRGAMPSSALAGAEWPRTAQPQVRLRYLPCSPIHREVTAGAATAWLRPDASPGPPLFTATFDHLTVASLHSQHHPDHSRDDRHANNKHQDGRHNTPLAPAPMKGTLRRIGPAR